MFLKAIVFLLKMKKLLQIPFPNDEFPPEAMEKFFQDSSLWVSCNFLEDIGQRYAGGYGEKFSGHLFVDVCTVFLKILAKGMPEAMEKIFQDSSLWVSCNFLEDICQVYAGGYGEIFCKIYMLSRYLNFVE